VVAVAQPACIPHDVGANAAAAAQAVLSAHADLVVFPELSVTGYELDAAPVAVDDPRLEAVVTACARSGSLALVGAPVRGVGGRIHIATLAVDAAGVRVAYRKRWLGVAEAVRFSAGSEAVVLDVRGWRVGLAICKDTGVTQHAAEAAALGMDLFAAGVVEHAHDREVQPERAQRIIAEHGVWVAVASFAGSTGGGFTDSAGESTIWGPDGVAVARAGTEVGAVVSATLA